MSHVSPHVLPYWGPTGGEDGERPAVIGLSLAAFLRLSRGGGRPARPGHPSAQHLLAEQFARGEIDELEYRRLAAALGTARPRREQAPHRPPPGPHPRR